MHDLSNRGCFFASITRSFERHPKKKKSQKSQKRRKIIHISNKMQHTFFFLGVYQKENLNWKKKAIFKRGKFCMWKEIQCKEKVQKGKKKQPQKRKKVWKYAHTSNRCMVHGSFSFGVHLKVQIWCWSKLSSLSGLKLWFECSNLTWVATNVLYPTPV